MPSFEFCICTIFFLNPDCGETMWNSQIEYWGYNTTFWSVCSQRLQENAMPDSWRCCCLSRLLEDSREDWMLEDYGVVACRRELVGLGSLEWWERSVCSLNWISGREGGWLRRSLVYIIQGWDCKKMKKSEIECERINTKPHWPKGSTESM